MSFYSLIISLAMSGVWKTATRFDSKESRVILSWDFITTEAAISFIIRKDDIVQPILTSTATPNYKYQVLKNQTTREIKITLAIYNITTLDSGVYRCSLDQLDVHKDIHLNITDLMPTSNLVISTLLQDAKLIWEYNNLRYPANKLIFSRENKTIAEWTSIGGFSYEEDQYRRKLMFNKTRIKGGKIDVITLIIRDTRIDDFNKTYYCNLFSAGRNMLTSEITLVLEIPVWVDPPSKVTVVLGEDVTFIWQYKYSIQPSYIIFRRRHEISASKTEPIGKWYNTEFVPYPKYNVTRMKKTDAEEGEIIELSLPKTLRDLFGSIFKCDITFQDGKILASEIKLMGDTYLTRITTGFTDTDLTAITADFTDTGLTTITTDFTDTDLTAITTYHPVIMTVEVDKSAWIHSNYHVILIPLAILFIVLLFYLITRFFVHWRKHTPTYYQQLEGYVPNVENSYTAIRHLSTVSSIDTHLYESCEENVLSNVDNGTLLSSSCTGVHLDYEYPMENTIEENPNPRRAAILRLHNHSASDRFDISFSDDNESLRYSSISHEYEYPTENQSHFDRFENCDTLCMGSLKSPIISSHASSILLDKYVKTDSSDSITSSELFEYPPSKQCETVKKSESMVTYYDTKLTSSHKEESEL